MQTEAREKQDKAASRDKEVQGGTPKTPRQETILQKMAKGEGRRRERRWLKCRIYSWQQEQGKKWRRRTEREKPRPELAVTTRPREGNRKPAGARIRRHTSLPQGAWRRLQREAGNYFNVWKATNTDRRHRAGAQSPEKGHRGLRPAPRRQEAQGGGPRAAAGEGQGRAGQSRQPGQKGTRQPGEFQALIPPYDQ